MSTELGVPSLACLRSYRICNCLALYDFDVYIHNVCVYLYMAICRCKTGKDDYFEEVDHRF